ncbi:glycosyl hydrolase family 28 protein [Aquisphaera insulae]|uniref:glycosyl hydrolase family 28 protein n=1 Tax=Aquisphaera insulae TaxID=2712864 RepID=UPI0013ED292E|nr:glycosyl hydrolase family 28 protein [Aquisphaera insulae]
MIHHARKATCLLILATSLIARAAAQVVTAPAPAGEPAGGDFQVWAGDQPVAVYAARTLDPPFAGKEWDYGGDYAFASFDSGGPVRVKITSTRSLAKVVIRPASPSVRIEHPDDHTLTLNLDGPRKLSVEPDGKRSPLLLFANALETNVPKKGDANVVYYGPGIHAPGTIRLGSNQTLYLAAGAVVKAEVLASGAHVRIRGRGILDGSGWEWRKGPIGNLIGIRDAEDVVVEGIILRGSSHWTIVPSGSRNVTIRNVKLCNARVQNDDGINPCNSQDVLITDCFIRTDDDCVALKGLRTDLTNNHVERITVENSVLWCDRARIFLLGHESRAAFMRAITLRNLDVLHFTMTAFLFEPGEEMRLEDVRIQDVRIHGEGQGSLIRLRPVVNQYMHTKTPGFIRDVAFRGVTVEGAAGAYLVEVMGADPVHDVRDVRFDEVRILGETLREGSKPVRIGEHVQGVRFGPTR